MSPRERWRLWGPAVLVAAIGMILGVLKAPPGGDVIWDKVSHAGSYFVLGLALLRATHGGFARPRPGPSALAVLLAVAHGVGIELLQAVVPWRQASVGDAVADLVGAVAAVALLAAVHAARGPGRA